jgi:hypothetical protein
MANEVKLTVPAPVQIPPVQGVPDEKDIQFQIPEVGMKGIPGGENMPLKKRVIPLSGKMITSEDPIIIGTNFRTLTNMRYSEASPKAVSGMTKINTTYDLDTYIETRAAHHFRKVQPAETPVIENHILAQAFTTAGTGSTVIQRLETLREVARQLLQRPSGQIRWEPPTSIPEDSPMLPKDVSPIVTGRIPVYGEVTGFLARDSSQRLRRLQVP